MHSSSHFFGHFRRLALFSAAALLVSGCSNMSNMLGADKTPPDEFRVVSRAPLSLPPDFGLVAPKPGAPRPQETDARETARQIVVDREGGAMPRAESPLLRGRDPGEAAFLRLAGADAANPDIRQTVNRESAMLAEAETGFVDSLIFWQNKEPPGVIVDPEKEARRLRENAALGRAPTAGETPTIKRRGSALDRGIFEGIF